MIPKGILEFLQSQYVKSVSVSTKIGLQVKKFEFYDFLETMNVEFVLKSTLNTSNFNIKTKRILITVSFLILILPDKTDCS